MRGSDGTRGNAGNGGVTARGSGRRPALGGARAAAAVLALALGAVACGGSSGGNASAPATSSASGGTSGSPSASGSNGTGSNGTGQSAPMSKSAATRLAAVINLKPSDLPAYRVTPAEKDSSDAAANARFTACIGGVPDSKAIVDVDSPDFSAGTGTQGRELSSNVTVLPSAALAAKDLAAARSPHARACLRTFVDSVLRKAANGQVTFSTARITALQPSAKGADGAFGYRVRVVAKGPSAKLPFYVDIIGFTKGPVEVALNAVSIGHGVPSALEHRLLDTLASRAQGSTAQT